MQPMRKYNMFKKYLLAVIYSLLFSSAAMAGETIRISTGEWAPYISESEPYQGFIVRIIDAAFALEGIDVQWIYYPWARAMLYAKEGKWDATAVWYDSEQRRKFFLYSDPIASSSLVFFHLKSTQFDWSTMDDLNGLTVGTTNGFFYGEAFHDALRRGIFAEQKVPSEVLNINKLLRGKIDLFAGDLQVGKLLIDRQLTPAQRAKITYHQLPLQNIELHLLLSKKNSRRQFFLEKFNAGLKELKAAGKVTDYIQMRLTPSIEAPLN